MARTPTAGPDLKATTLGVVAILLWASLALLTTRARGIPPFQILFLSFGVAFGLGMLVLSLGGRKRLAELRQPLAPWIAAFCAIFLYHALYFFALSWAPPAQASLIAYLWPLFIVLLAATRHLNEPRVWAPSILGGILGFAGTTLILTDNGPGDVQSAYLAGYIAALSCACIWSVYSVFNGRFRETPSGMLVGVCGAVAVAGLVFHGQTERWVTPDAEQWMAIIALGAGPTGFAFFAWDYATKYGHIAYLGILSYLAPLVSTALLIASRQVAVTPGLLIAAGLIIGGALIPKLTEFLLRSTRQRDSAA